VTHEDRDGIIVVADDLIQSGIQHLRHRFFSCGFVAAELLREVVDERWG
jgi:hypothetical protein